MSDVNGTETRVSKMKMLLDKLDGNPFFGFARPYLNFIGKGTIFSFVYFIMAVVSLILPFFVIYFVVDSGFLGEVGGRGVVAFIFSWFVIAFACWIGFQLWWNRRKQVTEVAESEFVAIPICAGILRTFGEWLGTLIGITGFGAGLIASIILGNYMRMLEMYFGIPGGPIVIFTGPVVGFFLLVLFRLLAELLKIVAALANNTKAIAENIKDR